LVVRVLEGTEARRPLGGAAITLLIAGEGADSGQVAARGFTASSGDVTLDALVPRRYDLLIRRPGYEPFRQRATVRAGFVDTVTVALRGARTC
jgi:hypothetical protein